MPAESQRLRRRVGTRDRRFLALLGCVAVIGTPLGVLIGRHDSSSTSTTARCVSTTRAHVMGAATFTYCGEDAASFCRSSAATDRHIAAQCEELGLPLRP